VSTTVISVVLYLDLQSSGRNEEIDVQLEGISEVREEENREPTPWVTLQYTGGKMAAKFLLTVPGIPPCPKHYLLPLNPPPTPLNFRRRNLGPYTAVTPFCLLSV
jgi:hypothetical protein